MHCLRHALRCMVHVNPPQTLQWVPNSHKTWWAADSICVVIVNALLRQHDCFICVLLWSLKCDKNTYTSLVYLVSTPRPVVRGGVRVREREKKWEREGEIDLSPNALLHMTGRSDMTLMTLCMSNACYCTYHPLPCILLSRIHHDSYTIQHACFCSSH